MNKYVGETNRLREILTLVAPGSPLRDGIDNVLRAKTGGLIVIGCSEKMQSIIDGGFSINCPFSSAHLYELAKMDGAIILNESCDRILYANTQLAPNPNIPSSETGMRHRTAERVAKQTGHLVIAISQRRNVITLYKESYRYSLNDIGVILTKANQAMQTLERYKNVLEQHITNLGALEMEKLVTYQDVITVLQHLEMVLRIRNEIYSYVNELGTEGRLIRLQMTEIVSNLEKEAALLLLDYTDDPACDYLDMLKKLQAFTDDALLSHTEMLKIVGFRHILDEDLSVSPKGYRLLRKIPRLPYSIIKKLVETYANLHSIMKASQEELERVEGIGRARAKNIKEGLSRIQEQLLLEREI